MTITCNTNIQNNMLSKIDFIRYNANRYGIDESVAETMVDMFTDSMQELISTGQSVSIDELGEFKTTPLFPNGIQCSNNKELNQLSEKNTVSFKISDYLSKA